MIPGVDISSIQGKLDFAALAKLYRFVIHRAYVGNDFLDHNLVTNLQAAKDAGMAVALYNFVYPLPEAPGKLNHAPKEQANLHFAAVQDLDISMHCCDLEFPIPQNWGQWKCSKEQVIQWTLEYLQEYESLSDSKPVLYSYPSFIQALGSPESFKDYDLWIASYTSAPHVPKPWDQDGWLIWQNSGGSIHFNGVAIDTDYVKDLSIFG